MGAVGRQEAGERRAAGRAGGFQQPVARLAAVHGVHGVHGVRGQQAGAGFSLKKAWDSARDLTKSAVAAPASSSSSSSGAGKDAADAMESGQMDGQVDDAAVAKWPLWRKNSTSEAGLIPSMSWYCQ